MKKNEFIRKINNMGYLIVAKETPDNHIRIFQGEFEIAAVKSTQFQMSTQHKYFSELNKDIQEELFGLCVEYAATPVEEREDAKKYVVKKGCYSRNSSRVYIESARTEETKDGAKTVVLLGGIGNALKYDNEESAVRLAAFVDGTVEEFSDERD